MGRLASLALMSDDLRPSRRIVFSGLGALGVAAALAGCSSGSDPDTAPSGGGSQKPTSAGPSGTVLAKTSEIPVGGGVILTDQHLVIVQPTKGTFLAYSAACKHQGFDVGKVEDGVITCLVHGSTYDAANGERTAGPAPTGSALTPATITVEGKDIVAA